MKTIDKVLWERELADHLRRHPDLHHLPPPVFPRLSRTGYLLAALMLFVTVLASAITGWWIGLYLI